MVSDVRAAAQVLGLRRQRGHGKAAAKRKRPPTSTRLRFRLSEAATVTVSVRRASAPGGAPRAPAARARSAGGRCTAWSVARQIKRPERAGANSVTLRSRGLRPGRYRVVLSATDAVGNRSQQRAIGLRVVRLPR